MPETNKSESLQSIYGSTKVRKDNKAFTKFKDGWIMGTNAMFIPKMFCTNFMFALGSKIKALETP